MVPLFPIQKNGNHPIIVYRQKETDVEIEKKFLVDQLPADLTQYDVWKIEQCYLCTAGLTLRIRKKNQDYILTYKSHIPTEEALNVAKETELPLTKEAFEHLKKKCDGLCIEKDRYLIPYEQWVIELDVFHGHYEGFCLAEIEFSSVEESRSFQPPYWLGKDVSGDYQYSNSYLSRK